MPANASQPIPPPTVANTPPTPPVSVAETKSSKRPFILLAIFIIVLLSSIAYMFLIVKGNLDNPFNAIKEKYQAATTTGSRTKDKKPSPSPSPMYLAPGKQTYNISHGSNVTGPKPTKAIIDPIDPAKNQEMTITIDITSDSNVTKSGIKILTDNNTILSELQLISGDKQNGTWQTKLKINDTYLYTYLLNFDLQSNSGNYTGGLTFRQ